MDDMKQNEDRTPPIEEVLMAAPTEASLREHVTDLLLGGLRDLRMGWSTREQSDVLQRIEAELEAYGNYFYPTEHRLRGGNRTASCSSAGRGPHCRDEQDFRIAKEESMKVEQDPNLSLAAAQETASYQQRHERGRAARQVVPRGSHAEWEPAPDRPDPVDLLEAQARDRNQELMPIRYARMMASPFAFMRGSAIIMANDLASTPKTGIQSQLCGDAHLLNFGAYASPERALLFDLNDFDESLPGPWEWDVKRLAASFVVAGRDNGFDAADCRGAAQASVASYRQRMAEFSEMGELEVWYSRVGEAEVKGLLSSARARKRTTKKLSKNVQKARGRDSLQALSKLTRVVDGRLRIIDDPPLLVRIPEEDEIRSQVYAILESYKRTLQDDRRRLLDRYRFVDAARKVVGSAAWATEPTWCC